MYDELVKRLRETSIDFGESDHVSVMLIEAADAIEELQKQLREEKVDNVNLTGWLAEEHAKAEDFENRLNLWRQDKIRRWIPVTERLPKYGQKVLVFSVYTMYVYKFCALDERCGAAKDHWRDDYGVAREIENGQFWMPLPQPPEDGET